MPIRSRAVITTSAYSSMFFLGIVIAVIGAAARNIGLTPPQIGILISAQNVGFIVGVLVAGLLADIHEKPRIMFWASIVLAVAFGAFYRIDLFWVNSLVMFLMGAGIGAYEGTSDALLLQIHDRNESFHINVNHFFVTLGSLIVTAYLIFLQMSWRRSMIQAAIAVCALAVLFFFLQAGRAPVESGGRHGRLAFLGRLPFLLAFTLLLLAVGSQLTVQSILTTYAMELREHDQVTSKLVIVAFLAGVGMGRILVGILTRKGRVVGTLMLLFGATALLASLFFLLDFGKLVYGMAVLMGITVSGLLPLSITVAGLAYRTSSGAAVSLIKFAIPLGGILVPLLFSAVSSVAALDRAVLVMPGLYLVGFVITLIGRPVLSRAIAEGSS